MSKSQQKRLCIQSKCVVRDELRQQLDRAQEKIKAVQEVVDLMLEDGSFGEEVYRNVVSKLQEIEALSKLKEQEVQGE